MYIRSSGQHLFINNIAEKSDASSLFVHLDQFLVNMLYCCNVPIELNLPEGFCEINVSLGFFAVSKAKTF